MTPDVPDFTDYNYNFDAKKKAQSAQKELIVSQSHLVQDPFERIDWNNYAKIEEDKLRTGQLIIYGRFTLYIISIY